MGEGSSENPSICLILKYESAVFDTTAKEASLPITASNSMDHGHPYGFRQKPGLQTSTWFPEAALIMDMNMISGSSMEHRYQHGLRAT